jgi:FG-GAP-like repeat
MTIGMHRHRHQALIVPIVLIGATLLPSRPALAQFIQQGPKLVGTTRVMANATLQGWAVAVSADGNTAIAGARNDEFGNGAAHIWTRSGGVWSQQGPKLDAAGGSQVGYSVSLSADGNTAIAGGIDDDGRTTAAWVWTRGGGVWTPQRSKLVAAGAAESDAQGLSVSLSADGNTAIVGGWVWTRSGGVWTQQGPKLVGSGAIGKAAQGASVSLSADGNTALVGGPGDDRPTGCCFSGNGAVWVWTRSGSVWTQQGPKLVGSGAVGNAAQGESVSLSADGNTAIVGGPFDNRAGGSGGQGAAWIWTRSNGVWSQQGSKLVGSGAVGGASQGTSVSLSGDGNTAVVGGPDDNEDFHASGAVWVWPRRGDVWTQQGSKLVGSGGSGSPDQGAAVALSADGTTAIVGGPFDDLGDPGGPGAVWVFVASPTPILALPDMDGDHKADLIVWRPSTGRWTWFTAATGFDSAVAGSKSWGSQDLGDVPLTGDIDGDGVADLIVWRASSGTWFWLTSSSGFRSAGQKAWGAPGDIARPADIDGDGIVDLVVWRPSTGTWYWLTSSTGYSYAAAGGRQWGNQALGDVPVVGDFDGDKRADLAVWRASSGTWYWLTSSSGFNYAAARGMQWGNSDLGDLPLLGDVDGDGLADLAVWRASTGTWYWLTSSSGYNYAAARGTQWGNGSLGDIPIVGDIDGDGLTDLTVWRASTGRWFWLTSSSGYNYAAQRQKQWSE